MQQIERYGVIALVFLLVTIVAVSFWSDGKSPGFWSRLSGRGAQKKEAPAEQPPATAERALEDALPLTPLVTPSEVVVAQPEPQPIGDPIQGEARIGDLAGGGSTRFTPLEPNPRETFPAPQPGPAIADQQPRAPQVSTSQHVVQKGESLAAIAKSRLGDESRWREIQSLNPGIDPKRLKVGQTLEMPTGAAPVLIVKPEPAKKASSKTTPAKAAPAKAPEKPAVAKAGSGAREHVVQRGETLRAIAKARLGDADRWREIVAVNPGLEPDRLRVGMKVRLPGGAERPAAPKAEKERPMVAVQKPVVR